jgi:hypothetical protein
MNKDVKNLIDEAVNDFFSNAPLKMIEQGDRIQHYDILAEEKVRIYNKTLCPDLWDRVKHLNPEIRINLLNLANDFYEKTKFVAPVLDVWLMGSIANYNWNQESDIDVHVIIDFSKLQMPAETAVKSAKSAGAQWNDQHEVIIKNHKVELNIQSINAEKPYVTGIYSLVKDQWIREPHPYLVHLDRLTIKEKYIQLKKYIEDSIHSGDREKMKAAKDFLDEFRQYGLNIAGELSVQNIVYKILRNKGLIKALKDSIVDIYDEKMSIDEVTRKNLKRVRPHNVDVVLNRKKCMSQAHRLTESSDLDYDAAADFFHRRDEQLIDLADLLKRSKGRGRVPWKTVPASLLKRVWFQFGKYKRININDLDKISDQILTNIARLQASTEMMGHTSHDVRPELEDLGFEFTDKQWDEWMSNYFTDKHGGWMLSDYGLTPLKEIYSQIFNADTPEEKLYAIDKALNVIHQRNDLSSMFVEGGRKTLRDIFNQGGYAVNKDEIKEAFYTSFDVDYGRGKTYVEIFKNPTRKEFLECKPHYEVGALLTDKDIYVWNREKAYHRTVMNKLKLENALPLLLTVDNTNIDRFDIMITDATKNTIWDENPKVKKFIINHPFFKHKKIDHISYWNEDIVGDWAGLKTNSELLDEEKNYYLLGDCRNENLIDDIFGSVSDFAGQVDRNGDEFVYGNIKVTYDPETDIHYFWKKNIESKNLEENKKINGQSVADHLYKKYGYKIENQIDMSDPGNIKNVNIIHGIMPATEMAESKLGNEYVYHNTEKSFLDGIKKEGLTHGEFSNKPIDVGGDIWLAVKKSDLPGPVREFEYGNVIAYLPKWEMGLDKDGYPIHTSIPLDKIILVNKKGMVISNLKEGYGAGNPEDDPLHIPRERWRIDWTKRKTPKMTTMEEDELINEVLEKLFENTSEIKNFYDSIIKPFLVAGVYNSYMERVLAKTDGDNIHKVRNLLGTISGGVYMVDFYFKNKKYKDIRRMIEIVSDAIKQIKIMTGVSL